MVLADTLPTVGQFASLVAARAAVAAVYFAKQTVSEAQQASREASVAHNDVPFQDGTGRNPRRRSAE